MENMVKLFCLSMYLQVGYIVTSCLLNENHDFLRLAINTVRNDIIGRNETFQCLALTLVWLLAHLNPLTCGKFIVYCSNVVHNLEVPIPFTPFVAGRKYWWPGVC